MTDMTERDVDTFLDRFHRFYDAVVRRVSLDFESRPLTCVVVVDAQDSLSASGWARVELHVGQVRSFRFEQGLKVFEVLSSGIQLGWQAGDVVLVLDAYPDDPGLPDLTSNSAYVVGAWCRWAAIPWVARPG